MLMSDICLGGGLSVLGKLAPREGDHYGGEVD